MNVDETTTANSGVGHVGLHTGSRLAELGWRVIGADNDAGKVELIRAGQPSFYETSLSELLLKRLQSGRFQTIPDVEAAHTDRWQKLP